MERKFDYLIHGRLTSSKNGKPISGVKVRAFDKDFFADQLLGDSLTDENGRYEIRFGRADFTGPIFRLERSPDIYVLVLDEKDTVIHTTQRAVIVNAGHTTLLDLTIPYGHDEGASSSESTIAGTRVNLSYSHKLTVSDLRDAYKLHRNPGYKPKNLKLILKAFPDLLHVHDTGDDCQEGFGDAIRLLLKERNADADTQDADDFQPGTTIRSFFTANTVTQYTLDENNIDVLTGAFAAIPAADANFNFPGGGALIGVIHSNLADLQAINPSNTEVAPEYVQKIGLMAEYSLNRFINPPFSFADPRNGQPLFILKVRNQGSPNLLGATHPAWDHVEVGISNSSTLLFGTVPHEMFHRVQYQYNSTGTRSGIYGILREGGARLLEDCIFDTPNRYIASASGASNTGIFPNPALSLLDGFPNSGQSTALNYAGGILWKYMAEQHSPFTNAADEPAIGIETYRTLLEKSSGSELAYTVEALRAARQQLPWYGTFDQHSYYDAGATELNSNESTYANFLAANYLHNSMVPGNPDFDRRFDYMEDGDPGSLPSLQLVRVATEEIAISQNSSIPVNISNHFPYASRYYVLTPTGTPGPRMVRVSYTSTLNMTDPLVQILRIGADDQLVDIHRSDKTQYSKTIHMEGLSKLVVIVSSRTVGGNFSLNIDEIPSASDVMITRWNSAKGTEYEINPQGWSWTWISPDIMVDTNDDGLDDVKVFFGVNNKLKVRLRNRGNRDVNNIQLDFWYQKATPFLSTNAWTPVQNLNNVTQQLTNQSLAAGEEAWFTVDWCPDNDGTNHNHWCVKVLATVAGDPNFDNKMAFRNFGNVQQADLDKEFFLMFRYHAKERSAHQVHLIPRSPRMRLEMLLSPEFPTGKSCFKPELSSTMLRYIAPDDVGFSKLKFSRAETVKWNGKTTLRPQDSGAYYPTPESALPPGVKPEDVTTVAHIIDGVVVGGMSYKIES